MRRLLLIVLFCLTPILAVAVQPDEVLDDPALETRAREISRVLRCVVCQGENIDESNADIARDLRILVRERLVAGDSNDAVLDFIVDRYGEYVLFRPPFSAANALLWLSGPLLLLIGFGFAIAVIRRGSSPTQAAPTPLSRDEQNRLKALTRE